MTFIFAKHALLVYNLTRVQRSTSLWLLLIIDGWLFIWLLLIIALYFNWFLTFFPFLLFQYLYLLSLSHCHIVSYPVTKSKTLASHICLHELLNIIFFLRLCRQHLFWLLVLPKLTIHGSKGLVMRYIILKRIMMIINYTEICWINSWLLLLHYISLIIGLYFL